MSLNREKIEKGELRKYVGVKAKIHKWMKNQINRRVRRKAKHIEEDDVVTIKKPYKGWEL